MYFLATICVICSFCWFIFDCQHLTSEMLIEIHQTCSWHSSLNWRLQYHYTFVSTGNSIKLFTTSNFGITNNRVQNTRDGVYIFTYLVLFENFTMCLTTIYMERTLVWRQLGLPRKHIWTVLSIYLSFRRLERKNWQFLSPKLNKPYNLFKFLTM